MMEHQNTREQLKDIRAKSQSTYKYLAYAVLGLSVFAGSMYWTLEDGQRKVRLLKEEKANLIYMQKSECDELKRELEGLVRKELFQLSYRNQQETMKEGIFMYSQNESNTSVRQLEITDSLEKVCTKNDEKIEAIDKELKRLLTSFAY